MPKHMRETLPLTISVQIIKKKSAVSNLYSANASQLSTFCAIEDKHLITVKRKGLRASADEGVVIPSSSDNKLHFPQTRRATSLPLFRKACKMDSRSWPPSLRSAHVPRHLERLAVIHTPTEHQS